MKSVFKFTSIILIAFLFLSINIANAKSSEPNITTFNMLDYPKRDDEVTHQRSRGQVYHFWRALDKLGATTPEQVVDLWVEAERSRNGVYQYAVACNELKDKIIEIWGEPDKGFWIIGGSSPWLDRHYVVYNKKIDDSTYETKIKYYWRTSAGPCEPTFDTLIIVKNKDYWCVKEVKE